MPASNAEQGGRDALLRKELRVIVNDNYTPLPQFWQLHSSFAFDLEIHFFFKTKVLREIAQGKGAPFHQRLYMKQADKRFLSLGNAVPSSFSNYRSQIKVVINII